MPYFLFDHQKDLTDQCNLSPIIEKDFYNGINNYLKRRKDYRKTLKKRNVNLKKEVYFSSFKKEHLLDFLKDIDENDYFVIRFASKIGKISNDHHSFMTPVIMKKDTCEIKKFMCRGGRRGQKIGPKSDREGYCKNALKYWNERNCNIKEVGHFQNECSGIAHLASDIKKLLSCKGVNQKYVNFIMMYSPVARLETPDRTEFKTTFAFYLSDNRSKSEIRSLLKKYKTKIGFKDYTEYKPLVEPYDNGHECCPI